MNLSIIKQPLPYEANLTDRNISQVELLVIHCTELPDLAMARSYGEVLHYDSKTGNSGHYYVDRDGGVYQWVKPEKIAHHVKGHNNQSIGIELVNNGRFPNWHQSNSQSPEESYGEPQINSLINLIKYLHREIPTLKHIAGHEDLDQSMLPATDDSNLSIRRKIDPGPLFPWEQVMKNIPLINIGSNAKNYE